MDAEIVLRIDYSADAGEDIGAVSRALAEVVAEQEGVMDAEVVGLIEDNIHPWLMQVMSRVKVPSGLDYVAPELVAELVTQFLVSLQRINADAYRAGKSDSGSVS